MCILGRAALCSLASSIVAIKDDDKDALDKLLRSISCSAEEVEFMLSLRHRVDSVRPAVKSCLRSLIEASGGGNEEIVAKASQMDITLADIEALELDSEGSLVNVNGF